MVTLKVVLITFQLGRFSNSDFSLALLENFLIGSKDSSFSGYLLFRDIDFFGVSSIQGNRDFRDIDFSGNRVFRGIEFVGESIISGNLVFRDI